MVSGKLDELLALAESTMTITPGELLETSIAQLQTLVAFLGEQLEGGAGGDTGQSSTLEVRACKDMLVSLTVLLQEPLNVMSLRPKSKATSALFTGSYAQMTDGVLHREALGV